MGVHTPGSRGETQAWESITQAQEPNRSAGVHHPNATCHTEARECITQTQVATPKRGTASSQVKVQY